MKKFNFIYKSLILILAAFFVACEVDSFSEDQYILGDINAPTSIAITSQIVGQSTENQTQMVQEQCISLLLLRMP